MTQAVEALTSFVGHLKDAGLARFFLTLGKIPLQRQVQCWIALILAGILRCYGEFEKPTGSTPMFLGEIIAPDPLPTDDVPADLKGLPKVGEVGVDPIGNASDRAEMCVVQHHEPAGLRQPAGIVNIDEDVIETVPAVNEDEIVLIAVFGGEWEVHVGTHALLDSYLRPA